jgi:hypothetical protein
MHKGYGLLDLQKYGSNKLCLCGSLHSTSTLPSAQSHEHTMSNQTAVLATGAALVAASLGLGYKRDPNVQHKDRSGAWCVVL